VDLRIERLTTDLEGDFFALMARDESGEGAWCWCSAWWTPTWEGFGDRTAEENRALRESLFADGVHDGYLGYVDGAPVGWMKAGPRDAMPKIASTFDLEPDPDVWAVSCFMVLPSYRGQGLGRRFFRAVLDDVRAQGVTAIEGYPLHGSGHEAGEVWTGPESLFVEAGFAEISRGPRRVVYRLDVSG
jgi:GNAT superfamily N-acetyltransferase